MRSEVYVSRFLRAFLPVMLVVLLLTGAGLFAQERFSGVNGVVYDSSKAVLPGAEVIITNIETQTDIYFNDRRRRQVSCPGSGRLAVIRSRRKKQDFQSPSILRSFFCWGKPSISTSRCRWAR